MPTDTATRPALVAGPADPDSPVRGALVVESIHDLSTAIGSGSWADVGLTSAVAAVDVAATVIDPVGTLIASGLGWLIEHVEPLNGWLDDLAGDDAAVRAFAQTWQNISGQVDGAADLLERSVRVDLEAMTGLAVDAYREHTRDVTGQLRAVAESGRTVAGALETCSLLVGAVRDLVRDALAQVVGTAISAALGLGLSLGTAAPAVAAQVSARVASLSGRVASSLARLVGSVRALAALVRQLEEALRGIAVTSGRPVDARLPVGLPSSGIRPMDLVPSTRPVVDGIVVAPSASGPRDLLGRTTPISKNVDEGTRRGLEGENEAARILAEHGFAVEQNPQVPGAKRPDYRIEGIIFDAYTPGVDTPTRSIRAALLRKIADGQANSFVVNLDVNEVPLGYVVRAFEIAPVEGLRQVIFLKHGEIHTYRPAHPPRRSELDGLL